MYYHSVQLTINNRRQTCYNYITHAIQCGTTSTNKITNLQFSSQKLIHIKARALATAAANSEKLDTGNR